MLHIFNPHHDLALANVCPTFKAPESALHMAHDLSLLPCWYARDGDTVVSDQEAKDIDCNLLPKINVVPPLSNIHGEYNEIFPWGWDNCIVKYLKQCSVDTELLPIQEEIDKIRELSHRGMSIRAMEYLRANIDNCILPQPAVQLTNIRSVCEFAEQHAEIVLKAPWSSSGKGVFWSKGKITPSIDGWCRRIIDKQGSVMGEIAYDKVQDFAMEFYCSKNGDVRFEGYSLFFTGRAGIYQGNRLMSNDDIEKELSNWISVDYLREIKDLWVKFIKENIISSYYGYLGVDMLIYREDSNFILNPAVEVNLRMTMGMVARIFYDRYMNAGSLGWLSFEHYPPGQLFSEHIMNKENNPLEIQDGKIIKGYISLCPINEETVYMAAAIIE